jgi:hypothetical protein
MLDAAEHALGLVGVEALGRILAEQPADHRPQRPRVRSRLRLVGDDGGEAGQRAIPVKRRLSFDRGIKRSAEPPQVS